MEAGMLCFDSQCSTIVDNLQQQSTIAHPHLNQLPPVLNPKWTNKGAATLGRKYRNEQPTQTSVAEIWWHTYQEEICATLRSSKIRLPTQQGRHKEVDKMRLYIY